MTQRCVILAVIGLFLVSPVRVAPLWAQERADSLEALLRRADGARRIELLSALVKEYAQTEPERAVTLSQEAQVLLRRFPDSGVEAGLVHEKARALAKMKRWDAAGAAVARARTAAHRAVQEREKARAPLRESYKRLGDIERLQGRIDEQQSRYGEALEAYERSRGYYEVARDEYGIANTYNDIGIIQKNMSDYEQALGSHKAALEIFKRLGKKHDIGSAYNGIGVVYANQGDYARALEHFLLSLEIKEALDDRFDIAGSLNNIGGLYHFLGQEEHALDYFQRALAMYREIENDQMIGTSLYNIGIIKAEQEDYEVARSFFARALPLLQSSGDKRAATYALVDLANADMKLGRPDSALQSFEEARVAFEAMQDRSGLGETLLVLGALYLDQGAYAEAEEALQESVEIAHAIGNTRAEGDSYSTLAKVYEAREEYKNALAAYKAYKAANDSLFNAESRVAIADLEAKYQTKDQQQQITLLERKRQIQRLWVWGLVGGLLLVSFIASLITNRYRFKHRAHLVLGKAHRDLQQAHDQLKATQAQLVHAEKMASLGQLTAGIAHEIKNPLNFINNFADLNAELARELRERYQGVHRPQGQAYADGVEEILNDLEDNTVRIVNHGRRADQIVEMMMHHAGHSSGKRSATDLNTLLKESVSLAYHSVQGQHLLDRLKVDIEYDEAAGEVDIEPQGIGRVVLNLLNNAFYAVQEQAQHQSASFIPTVRVATRRLKDHVQILVQDNGIGISQRVQSRIFEPFFTTKPAGRGTGLGLSLSYDIITQGHGGTLTVDSREGKGATFVVALPAREPVPAGALAG